MLRVSTAALVLLVGFTYGQYWPGLDGQRDPNLQQGPPQYGPRQQGPNPQQGPPQYGPRHQIPSQHIPVEHGPPQHEPDHVNVIPGLGSVRTVCFKVLDGLDPPIYIPMGSQTPNSNGPSPTTGYQQPPVQRSPRDPEGELRELLSERKPLNCSGCPEK